MLSKYQIFVDTFHVLPSVLFDLPFASSWDLEKKYPEIVSYTLFKAPMVITQTLLLFILNNCSPSVSPILRIPFWLSPLGFPAHFLQYSNPNNSLNLSLYLNPKAFYLHQHIIYILAPSHLAELAVWNPKSDYIHLLSALSLELNVAREKPY